MSKWEKMHSLIYFWHMCNKEEWENKEINKARLVRCAEICANVFKRLSSTRKKREELRCVLPQLSVSEGIFEIRLRASASLKAGTAGVNISAARIYAPGARIKEGVPGRQTEFFIRTPSLIKLSFAHSLLGRDYFWCTAISVGDSCTLRSHTHTLPHQNILCSKCHSLPTCNSTTNATTGTRRVHLSD